MSYLDNRKKAKLTPKTSGSSSSRDQLTESLAGYDQRGAQTQSDRFAAAHGGAPATPAQRGYLAKRYAATGRTYKPTAPAPQPSSLTGEDLGKNWMADSRKRAPSQIQTLQDYTANKNANSKPDQNAVTEKGKAIGGQLAAGLAELFKNVVDFTQFTADQTTKNTKAISLQKSLDAITGGYNPLVDNEAIRQAKARKYGAPLIQNQNNAMTDMLDPTARSKRESTPLTGLEQSRQTNLAKNQARVDKLDSWSDLQDEGYLSKAIAGGARSAAQSLSLYIPFVGPLIYNSTAYRQNAEQKYQQMAQSGQPVDMAKLSTYAMGATVVDYATERMFDMFKLARGISDPLEAAGKKALRPTSVGWMDTLLENLSEPALKAPTVGQLFKTGLYAGAGESFEELASAFGTGLVAKATTDPDATYFTWFEKDGGLVNLDQIGQAMIGAFALGSVNSSIANLSHFKQSRALLKTTMGKDWKTLTPAEMEHAIATIRKDAENPAARAEIIAATGNALVDTQNSGEQVLDTTTGMTYTVSMPNAEGVIALTNKAGKVAATLHADELQAAMDNGIYTKATPAAQAVTDGSLPVTNTPTVGVVQRDMADGGTATQHQTSFAAPNQQTGTVTAEATGKKVLVRIDNPGTGVPYSFEMDAEDYLRQRAAGQSRVSLIGASAKSASGYGIGTYVAKHVGVKGQQDGFYQAVTDAVDASVDNQIATVRAEQEAKQAESVKQEVKAVTKDTAPSKVKEVRKLARDVQAKAAAGDTRKTKIHKALTQIDAENPDSLYNESSDDQLTRKHRQIADLVAKATGKEVVFLHSAMGTDHLNGFVTREDDDTVYINDGVTEVYNPAWVVGHELFHLADNAGIAKAFEDAALASLNMTREEMAAGYIAEMAAAGHDAYAAALRAKPELAFKEALADRAADVFSSPEALERLAKKAGVTKFQRFMDSARAWLSKVRDIAPKEIDALVEAFAALKDYTPPAPVKGVNEATQAVMDDHGFNPDPNNIQHSFRGVTEAAEEGKLKIIMGTISDELRAKHPKLSDDKFDQLLRKEASRRSQLVNDLTSTTLNLFEEISSRYPEYFKRMTEETIHTSKGPIRENSGGYIYTFDLDTLCTRAIQFRAMTNGLIKKLGRFPTEVELTALLFQMRETGDLIPCIYCYVESKRRLQMDSFNVLANTKQNIFTGMAANPSLTEDEALAQFGSLMYGQKSGDEEIEVAEDGEPLPSGGLTKAARKVFRRWYNEAKAGTLQPMSAEELFEGYQSVRKEIFGLLDTKVDRAADRGKELKRLAAEVADELGIEDRSGKEAFAWRNVVAIVDEWNYHDQSPGMTPEFYGADNKIPASDRVAYLHNFMESTDYSNSASSAKGVDLFEHYTDQLASLSVNNKIDMNAHGGFRIHSSNDFRVDHALDYALFITQLALDKRGGQGWKSHMYTKSVVCARFLAKTGIKINGSVAFNTDPATGKISVNIKEGLPLKDVLQLREISPDFGAMAMVVDDAQLEYCLNAPWVDQIIPFHMSGMKKAIWGDLLGWLDYTRVQSDQPAAKVGDFLEAEMNRTGLTSYEAVRDLHPNRQPGLFVKAKGALKPYKLSLLPYDKVIPGLRFKDGTPAINTTAKDPVQGWKVEGWRGANDAESVAKYFGICQQYGLCPRFWNHILPSGVRLTDHPGYIKLLKETARMDTPQRDVEAIFDNAQIKEMLEQFVGHKGYQSLEEYDQGKLDYFMKNFFDQDASGKYIFKEDMNPLKAGLVNLLKLGGVDLSRLTIEQIAEHKSTIDKYYTKSGRGNNVKFTPKEGTLALAKDLMERMPPAMLKAYGLPDISVVDGLGLENFHNYLDPGSEAMRDMVQNTLMAQQNQPATLTWLDHLNIQEEKPVRLAKAVAIVANWKNEGAMYTTRDEQVSMMAKALNLVHLEEQIKATLSGQGLLYSVRGPVSRKAADNLKIKTFFDAFAGVPVKRKALNFIGSDASSIRQIAAMAQLVRDPRVEHRHIYAVKDGVVVHHEAWSSNMPAEALALPDRDVQAVMWRRIQELQPDAIYFSHNHPSGNPMPSSADRKAAEYLQNQLPKGIYKGEIITNHNCFTTLEIQADGSILTDAGVFKRGEGDHQGLDKAWALKRGAEAAQPITAQRLWSAATDTMPGLRIGKEDVTLVYFGAGAKVTGIQNVPVELANDIEKMDAYLKKARPLFSATGVVAYTEDPATQSKLYKHILDKSVALLSDSVLGDMVVRDSLDEFGGKAFYSPLRAWLNAAIAKSPNKKEGAKVWDKLIGSAPFKSGYEYEFLGLRDWLLEQKSVTAEEILSYYDAHANLMTESVYTDPAQWSNYSPSAELPSTDGVMWSNYRANVVTMDKAAIPVSFSNSDSRLHFPEAKSVMMHTRMEDLTSPDFPNGATYLIEAQSDLHSEGQLKGYAPKESWSSSDINASRAKTNAMVAGIGGSEGLNVAKQELIEVLGRYETDFREGEGSRILRLAFKQAREVSAVLGKTKIGITDVINSWKYLANRVKANPEGMRDIIASQFEPYTTEVLIDPDKYHKYLLAAAAAGAPVKFDGDFLELDGISKKDAADMVVAWISKSSALVKSLNALTVYADSYDHQRDSFGLDRIIRMVELLTAAGNGLDQDNIQYAVASLNSFFDLGGGALNDLDFPATQTVLNTLEQASVEELNSNMMGLSPTNLNPEAPFGKDYMLLGFKTALRDAVNAGHDAVLWAGWMHAKRWHVPGGVVFAKINKIIEQDGLPVAAMVDYRTTSNNQTQFNKPIPYDVANNTDYFANTFGVEMGNALRKAGVGELVHGQSRTDSAGKKIHNAAVPRMYDEELVKQVTKYTKQWNTAPVYREVEGLGYQWVLPITPEARAAVESGPQVAYSMRERATADLFSEEWLSKPTAARITDVHRYYDVQTHQTTLHAAALLLDKTPGLARNMALNTKGPTNAVATILRGYFMFEADRRGDHDEAANWAMVTANAGTSYGQAIEAYKMIRRLDPEGLRMMATRNINHMLTPEQVLDVNRLTAKLSAELRRLDQEALEQALKSLELDRLRQLLETSEGRQEALEARLADMEADIKLYEADPIRRFIETLHDIAVATVPYQDMYQGDDMTGFLRWAIAHPALMARTWNMAYDAVYNMMYGDSAFMQEIEGYFGDFLPARKRTGLRMTQRSYAEILKAIKEHYESEDHTANALFSRLIELGVDPTDSVVIAHTMVRELGRLTKTQKLRSLTRLVPAMKRSNRDVKAKLIRLVNLANEKNLNDQTARAAAANIMGLPGLSAELQAEVSGISAEIGAIQRNARMQGRPLSEVEERAVDFRMAMLLARIQQQKPVKFLDKLENIRYMMMLSWVKAAERNIIGNAMFAGTDMGKDYVAAVFDRVQAAALGTNATVPWVKWKAAYYGALKGFRYAKQDILANVNTSQLDTQYSINQGQMFTSKVGVLANQIYRFKLALPDRVFQTAAYESHLAGLRKMNDARTPEQRMTEAEMKEQALYFAAKKTFTDDTVLGKMFSEIRTALNLGYNFGLGSIIMPFVKVPAALLTRTIEYTPLSVFRLMAYLVKHTYGVGWRGEGKTEWHEKYQKKFSTALADATFGSLATLGLGVLLRALGLITGEPPEDTNQRNLANILGIGRGYQMNWSALRRFFGSGFDGLGATFASKGKLRPAACEPQDGDVITTYSWAAPMSLGMSIGANWFDQHQKFYNKEGEYVGSFGAEVLLAFASGTQSITEQSMMQGVAGLMQAGQFTSNFHFVEGEDSSSKPYAVEALLSVAVSYPSSFVPNQLKILREAIDNNQRNVYDQNYAIYAYNMLLNKLPGLSQTLAQKYDVLGHERKLYQSEGLTRYFDIMLNPTLANRYVPDQNALTALNVIAHKTVDDSVKLPTAKRYLTVGGARFELTAQDQAELQRIVGTAIDTGFSNMPKGLTVDEQAVMMHDTISLASKKAAAKIYAQNASRR
jgi:hypothetical protein